MTKNIVSAMPVDPIITVIRGELARKHLSQKELSEYLNMSDKHVSRMLNGYSGVALPIIRQMLNFVCLELEVRECDE